MRLGARWSQSRELVIGAIGEGSQVKRLGKTVAALGVTMAFGAAVPAPAGAVPASRAAELCRELDERGVLDQPVYDITRGECVAWLIDEEGKTSFFAGICGFQFVRELTDTTNKGQCIKAVRVLLAG